MALAWGRALGEFGATLMFAGSFQGITQTAPLAIFATFARDFPAALALSAVLVAASAAPAAGGEAARPLAAARRRPGLTMVAEPAGLRARIASALREFELEVELEVDPGRQPGARRPLGRRQEHRAARDRRPAPARPRPGGARRAPLARHRGRDRPAAGAARLRLPVPAVRPVPAPERVAQRRLRAHRRPPLRAPRAGGRASCAASAPRRSPTRRCASSPAASASEWRWRARSPATRPWCCSTSHCRRSTRVPRPRRRGGWARPWRPLPRRPCSSPTISPRPRCWRGRSRSSTAAGSSSAAPPPS